jgi:aminoglycoside phosphotransferase (APT) family kinase protein
MSLERSQAAPVHTGTPAAEVDLDATAVRRLLAGQHPDLASQPLRRMASGWDNVLWRLGDRLAVRLPRREVAAKLIRHEQRWLPVLADRLPLAVPAPLRCGNPAAGYPWSWSVVPWLPGSTADIAHPHGGQASVLARFLCALHAPAPADAPVNPFRSVPLAVRDSTLRARMARLAADGVTLAPRIHSI